MLFNSIEYLLFFPTVFIIYWYALKKNFYLQNVFLLSASYFFYGMWDWRFLSLIFLSSLIDYSVGSQIPQASQLKKKILLCISLIANLGMLAIFKYFNFFIENFILLFDQIGLSTNLKVLHLILPVGISFYTFQTLSYTIDVYKGRIEPSKSWISFFTFVSFFPQLVAGPIERAKDLLPQFNKRRIFLRSEGISGLRQILYGLFKKVVIADSCAPIVNEVFANVDDASSLNLITAAFLFAIQIYCDFSGYTDIAIGSAKLLGIKLKKNFNFPYFSRDIAEFWRRWHISLSSWFKDYIYIPLGGSRGSKARTLMNVFVIFIISGFWHGANWTFIVWGGIHASLYIPVFIAGTNRKHIANIAKNELSVLDLINMLFTFLMVCIAWVFFRAENLTQAIYYLQSIFTNWSNQGIIHDPSIYLPVIVFIIWEWTQRNKSFGLDIGKLNITIRWLFYLFLIIAIVYSSGENQEFIYFQF